MDRRIVKTRLNLQEALLSLLREMPMEQIEIQTITDRANTARVTFYRHYATREELLLDTLERIYQDLKPEFFVPSIEHLLDFEQKPPAYPLFAFIARDRPLYKNLFTGTLSGLIQKQVRHYMVRQIIHTFSAVPRYADLPIVLVANHFASTTLGNIMWWLSEDLPYSIEYMARLTHWMSLTGALTLLGRGGDLKLPPPDVWRIPEI